MKGSKDSDDILDSKKNLSQKNGILILGWHPGPEVKLTKKAKTCPHYDNTHKKTQTQNEKKNFQSKLEDFKYPLQMFEQLSSSIGW